MLGIQVSVHMRNLCVRWTPHPVIVIIMDNKDDIIPYHYYRVGGPPNLRDGAARLLNARTNPMGMGSSAKVAQAPIPVLTTFLHNPRRYGATMVL